MRFALIVLAITAACVDVPDEPLPDGDVLDVDANLVDAVTDGRDTDAPDAAPSTLTLSTIIRVGPDGDDAYAQVSVFYDCPAGAAPGPHRGALELYYLTESIVEPVDWHCGGFSQFAWFNLPCGVQVQGRGVALDPVSGEPVYALTEILDTRTCAP